MTATAAMDLGMPECGPRFQAPILPETEIGISDHEFALMRSLVYERIGIRLNENKRMLMEGRLRRILNARGIQSFRAYYDLLQSETSGDALTEFIGRITTNFTFFNRESDHFTFLDNVILPRFLGQGTERLRIWSAGCATGPEAYDLALHVHEKAAGVPLQGVTILGTDVSRKAITAANRGVYSEDSLKRLRPQHLAAYFSRSEEGQFSVRENLRSMVTFRVLNLLREVYPFQHKFHVIFCRNVMIYFDEPTRLALVRRLHDYLVPGGYLILGHSESLLARQTEFRSEGASVYSRR